MILNFTMPMIPPTATAQEHKVSAKGGKVRFYDPPEVVAAREKLTAHLAQHRPPEPLEGAVKLTVMWVYPKEGVEQLIPKTTKPDTDNLQKLFKDCMTKLGFWKDDSQVYCEWVSKYYGTSPKIVVVIDYEDY